MNMQKDKQTVILARRHAERQDDRNTGEGYTQKGRQTGISQIEQ
jgi:hypothetical protein